MTPRRSMLTILRILTCVIAAAALGCSADRGPAESSESAAVDASNSESNHSETVSADAGGDDAATAADAVGPGGSAKPAAPAQAAATDDGLPKSAQPDVLSDEELAEGWIALFDGHSLFGWRATSDADWRVEDGAIRVGSGEKGLLLTTTRFSDYVLKLDFRSEPKTNSGIFLHVLDAVGPRDVAEHCYELNIAPQDNPFPTGSLVSRQKAEGDWNSDDWQTYEVTLEGGQVRIKLDGQLVLEYADRNPLGRGAIGLQLNEGPVQFRNIKLKPLNVASIFNGRDLSGWSTPEETESRFTVTDEGVLHVENGPGYIESEQAYDDFVLQLEAISNGKHLNSGIFFRCIPGEKMNGYESQIHNGYVDNDRTQPIDCGTGGIFRRQDARRVVPDDFEWFHKTIVAHGPHMAVWVNGYQVSDWTDPRQPDKNPRRGLRVAPGTIMIQGHDPTTDLSFRNLRAGELAPRPNAP